jgi:glycosyltransferase involved in cell wall biosynthesis
VHWLQASDRTAIDALGGSTVTIRETAGRMISEGDRATWITGRLTDALPLDGYYAGIHVLGFEARNMSEGRLLVRMFRGFRSRFRELASDELPDAALVHQPLAGAALAGSLRSAGVPSCYFFHGPWAPEYLVQRGDTPARRAAGWLRSTIEDRAVRSFRRIAVFSNTMADWLHETHPRAARPVRVTPGIDLDRFRPPEDVAAERTALGWPVEGPIIVSVRRLVPRMGLDLLIRATSLLSDDIPDLRLYIGGKGPLREELESLANALDLQDRVRFMGFVPEEDLARAYGAADLVCVPTRALEGLGLVTLEAMACGTPVVATPVGGSRELLEPFRSDLMPDEVTADALAETIHEVLSAGRDACADLGRNARRHVEGRYGWERTVADLRTLLETGP